MSINLEQGCKKFEEETGIPIDKYATEEAVSQVVEDLELSASFASTILVPVVIMNLIFALLSVAAGYFYKSYLIGNMLFLSSLFISLIGTGLLRFNTALNNLIRGMNSVLVYLAGFITAVYKSVKQEKCRKVVLFEICRTTVLYILLPVLQTMFSKKLYGGVAFRIVKKILLRSVGFITNTVEKNCVDIKESEVGKSDLLDCQNEKLVSDSENKDFKIAMAEKVRGFSSKVAKTLLIITKVFGIASIILGVLLIVSLLIIRNFIVF